MNRSLSFLGAALVSAMAQAQATHELTNVGIMFSPDEITMAPGDNIHLVLASPHTCTQVDQATWNANGTISNGGFNFTAGEHTFSLNVPGTYYYVCMVHASMGMKGKIVVEEETGIHEGIDRGKLHLYPNPARNEVHINGFEQGQTVEVRDAALRLVLGATAKADGLLDISPLTPGNYTVFVRDAKGHRMASLPLVVIPF